MESLLCKSVYVHLSVMCVCFMGKKITMSVPDEYSLTSAKSVRVQSANPEIVMRSGICLVNQTLFWLLAISYSHPTLVHNYVE